MLYRTLDPWPDTVQPVRATLAGGPRTLSSTSGWRTATPATATARRRGVLCTATVPCASRSRASSAGTRSLPPSQGLEGLKQGQQCPACSPAGTSSVHKLAKRQDEHSFSCNTLNAIMKKGATGVLGGASIMRQHITHPLVHHRDLF